MHDVVPLRNTGKSPPGAPVNGSRSAPGANTVRTLLTLAGLLVTLPVDAVIVALALLGRARPPAAEQAGTSRRTVLITGGKMTKALQLARSFHRAGHRVILADTAKYRFTGHRFSKAVDAFYCIPEPGGASYDSVLFDIVRYEAVDTVIPVSSPAASVPDARAHYFLDGLCEVMHGAEDTVRMLDDKAEFSKVAVALGLRVPSWIRVTDPQQILNFEFLEGRSYVLKRIAYSPVGRLDLPGCRGKHHSSTLRWRAGCRFPRKTRGSCRSSSRVASTAPTAPRSREACRSTSAVSPRRPNSTMRWSIVPRFVPGSSDS